MKKTSVYLDTSIINFLFAKDSPEKQNNTIDFFKNYINKNIYDVYISPIVIDEINRTSDLKQKNKLLNVIQHYNLKIIDFSEFEEEIKLLAQKYIKHCVIPPKKIEDALHIAICILFEIDVLLSWNFQHLANINKERKITSINRLEGYNHILKMCTPLEVMYAEE